jgi:beta-glucosidase
MRAFILFAYFGAGLVDSHDPSLYDPVTALVARVLANMSLAEKARQLVIHSADTFITANGEFDASKAASYLGTLGAGVFDSLGRNVDPTISNTAMRAAVASSSHGVGVIIAEECQHGVQGDSHTMFPSPISMAAAFDTELLREVGRVMGIEARASGITQCWSPVCGLAREPRWGRAEEEYGEDTYLAGELVGALVAGMAGAENLTSPDAVSSLVKHYAGYSVPQGGHNAAPSQLGGMRGLLAEYLPVFGKAVAAGAQGVMSSYNEVDGVPTSGDPWLLHDVLRGQLGFDGYVSSDFGAISGLGPNNHAIAANDSDCVRQFLEAGGALNGHDFEPNYESLVVELVTSGAMPPAVLDRAAGDVLRVKARLGLLQGVGPGSPAIVDPTRVASLLGDNSTHAAVALRAARESVVVVKNGGLLPLSAGALKTVLVVGPNADAIRAGDYSAAGWAGGSPNGGGNINNANAVTTLQALKVLLPGAAVTWAPGANLLCAPLRDPAAINTPLWSTVQRHSVSLAAPFSPTAPAIPFRGPAEPPGGPFPAGAPGLAATYFAGANSSVVTMTRLDAAPNFHWFALGPDMWRARSRTFRVRWEGTITPDASVKGGGLKASACGGSVCPGDGRVMGARVWLDGALMIDAWAGGKNDAVVDWARGVGRELAVEYWQDGTVTDSAFFLQWSMLSTVQTVGQAVDEAVALARAADVVIAVVGGANNDHAATTEGEGVDRAALTLGGSQAPLLEGLLAGGVGGKLVAVHMGSKPVAEPVLDGLEALVVAFQGGQACGQAVAEVLLGVTEPSGRLPISFPYSAEVLPVYYSRRKSANDGSYCDVGGGGVVRFPFGAGLSYTTFEVSGLDVRTQAVGANGTAVVAATVANTGRRAGWAVPQLYLRRAVASVTTPSLELKGFARLFLQPGDRATAVFEVDVARELRVWGRDLVARVEPGNITVKVGVSSAEQPLVGWFVVENM